MSGILSSSNVIVLTGAAKPAGLRLMGSARTVWMMVKKFNAGQISRAIVSAKSGDVLVPEFIVVRFKRYGDSGGMCPNLSRGRLLQIPSIGSI